MIVFDIETGPRLDLPVEPPPPFDEDAVGAKLAERYVKDDTIQRHLDKARSEYLESLANWDERQREQWPLDPALGCVVGWSVAHSTELSPQAVIVGHDVADEADAIRQLFQLVDTSLKRGHHIAGHNILNFDLPFLMARAWCLGLRTPPGIGTWDRGFFRWNPLFIDTGKLWLMGRHPGMSSWSFATCAKAFGTSGKVAGVEGKDVWRLIRDGQYDAVRHYMLQDVVQPLAWIRRIVEFSGSTYLAVEL